MKRIETIAATIFGTAFLFLAVAVATETTMRKVFNRSLQGVDELGGYVLAIGAALTFVVALVSRAHIRIDIVHERLPRALRIGLNAVALVSIAVVSVALLAMAWMALQDSVLFNSTAQTPWATPLQWPQAGWVAALALFVLVATGEAVRLAGQAVAGRWDTIDRDYGPRGSKDELEEELQDLKARGVVGDAVPGERP